jgi:hypothetical protein
MTKRNILFILPCLLSTLALAACSGAPDDAAAAPCDRDPEEQIGTRARYLNAKGVLNGEGLNGGYLNGGYVNGIQSNGGYLNGVELQGISLQGGKLQGTRLNGLQVNGVAWNGIEANGLQINGAAPNELVGTTDDGRAVSGDAFVGATLSAILSTGETIDLTIASFERDEAEGTARYRLEHKGENLCGGSETGIFLPGAWDATAARHDALTVGGHTVTTSFSCSTGMLAKCVRWGYAPWKVGADVHQTCTRMGRADYCGTGTSYTKDGTLIDLYDVNGVQAPTTDDASLVFEAAWGPNGAVCVNRTRYDAKTPAGAAVLPSCWASLPRCASLDEARQLGATMGNASRVQSRTICAAAGSTASGTKTSAKTECLSGNRMNQACL